MKFLFSVIFTLIVLLQISAQNDNPEILIGECTRELLQQGEFGQHFLQEYQSYKPDAEILNEITHGIYCYSITVVLGTWCQDSQEQVPRFYNILDKIDYNTNNVRIVCVDKDKTGGETNISNLNIELVPTFIFYKNDIEKGRIIETPLSTFEADIVNILNN